jgi:hypothetical protein
MIRRRGSQPDHHSSSARPSPTRLLVDTGFGNADRHTGEVRTTGRRIPFEICEVLSAGFFGGVELNDVRVVKARWLGVVGPTNYKRPNQQNSRAHISPRDCAWRSSSGSKPLERTGASPSVPWLSNRTASSISRCTGSLDSVIRSFAIRLRRHSRHRLAGAMVAVQRT